MNLLGNMKIQGRRSCKGHFSGMIRSIIHLLAETNQFSLICPFLFPFCPDGVQDRGVRNLGLHREQSRGKLLSVPRNDLQCHCLSVVTQKLLVFCLVFQVFDGAVIVLSLAPMVASTVANGPSSPWDAIGLIITLRLWRVKRIIDGEPRGASVLNSSGFYCKVVFDTSASAAIFSLEVVAVFCLFTRCNIYCKTCSAHKKLLKLNDLILQEQHFKTKAKILRPRVVFFLHYRMYLKGYYCVLEQSLNIFYNNCMHFLKCNDFQCKSTTTY